MPSTFLTRPDKVRRLFPDYEQVEQQYFRDTGIFPIMHTVVIRREVYEENRWVAQALYKAFVEAQRHTYEDLYVTAALKTMLPWLTAHVEQTRAMMGEDYWPYGFELNRETLSTFLRYHHECGLSPRLLDAQELFAPEAMESFKI
jgi:4,5-dihydroxyphthalate decarboxylase